MVIVIYYVFLIYFVMFDSFYSLIYLIFTACEGALGLSILVIIRRTHGGDYFKSFNVIMS
jgi:NADH-ubiquinone oxidoreductase chain 4L